MSAARTPKGLFLLTMLQRYVEKLVAKGRVGAALPFLRATYGVARALFGPPDPSTIVVVKMTEGRFLSSSGRYEEAIVVQKQAVDICERRLESNDPYTSLCLIELADTYRRFGHYSEALGLYQRSLAIRECALGTSHPDTAKCLIGLADIYRELGRSPEATELHRKAVDILARALGKDHEETASALSELACDYCKSGKYQKALALQEHVLCVYERVFGPDHPNTAKCLSDIASIHRVTDQHEQALAIFKRSLFVSERILGPYHVRTAAIMNNMAHVYGDLKDHQQALEFQKRALSVSERVYGPENPITAISLANISFTYSALGNNRQALKHLERSLDIDEKFLWRISPLQAHEERMQSIENDNFHVLVTLVTQHFADDAQTVDALFHRTMRQKSLEGEFFALQREAVFSGRYPELRELFNRLAAVRRQIAVWSQTDMALFWSEITASEREATEIERQIATRNPKFAHAVQQRQVERTSLGITLPPKSRVIEFLKYGYWDGEESRFKEDRYMAFIVDTADRNSQESDEALGRYCTPADAGKATRLSSRSFKQMFRLQKRVPPDDVQSRIKVTLVDIGDCITIDPLIHTFLLEMKRRTENPRGEKAGSPQRARSLRGTPLERLQSLLWTPLVAHLEGVQEVIIAPDSQLAFVPFHLFLSSDSHTLAPTHDTERNGPTRIRYVNTAAELLQHEWPIPKSPPLILGDPNFGLRTSSRLPSHHNEQEVTESMGTVHTLTDSNQDNPDEKDRMRGGNVNRAGLSFTRLPGSNLEVKQVSQYIGTTPITWNNATDATLRRGCQAPSVLYVSTHGFVIEDDYIQQEVEQAHRLGIDSYRRVGKLVENPLLRSGIALAGAQTHQNGLSTDMLPEAGTGVFTAYDVTGLDLAGTVVILPCCFTAYGVERRGRGVLGLRTAFCHAGARALILTLWPVDDLATGIFMEEFCRLIGSEEKRPLDQALRKAQIYLRDLTVGALKRSTWTADDTLCWLQSALSEETDPAGQANIQTMLDTIDGLRQASTEQNAVTPFRDPAFWAPFICIGEPAPLVVNGGEKMALPAIW